MKLLLLLPLSLGLVLAGGQPAMAQTAPASQAGTPAAPCGTFSGRVSADSKPLSGASVFVKGTNIFIITNEEGFFTLPARVTQFPTLAVSAAGYAPQEVTLSSCTPLDLELQILPGTRIKQHGKRKGFIMKTGQ